MTDQPHDPTAFLLQRQDTSLQQEQKTWLKWGLVLYVYFHLVVLVGTVLADLRHTYDYAPWPGWMKPFVKHWEWVVDLPSSIEAFYGVGFLMILFSPFWYIGVSHVYKRDPNNPQILWLGIAEFSIILCQMLALIPGCQ